MPSEMKPILSVSCSAKERYRSGSPRKSVTNPSIATHRQRSASPPKYCRIKPSPSSSSCSWEKIIMIHSPPPLRRTVNVPLPTVSVQIFFRTSYFDRIANSFKFMMGRRAGVQDSFNIPAPAVIPADPDRLHDALFVTAADHG